MTTTTAPPPTTTSTLPLTTTTTLDNQGVLHTFIGSVTDPSFTAKVDIKIDVTAGGAAISGTGHGELHGEDSHFAIEYSGLPAQEMISLAGVEYERTGEGPWFDRMSKAKDTFAEPAVGDYSPVEDIELVAFLKTLGELEHLGTVQQEEVVLHRIGIPEGVEADPVAFGFSPEDEVVLEVSFLAQRNGLPYEIDFEIVNLADPDVPITMNMVMRFVDVGIPVLITPPDEVWFWHASADAGYSIAHPRSWDVEEIRDEAGYAEDRFYGLRGDELLVATIDIDPPGQVPLNSWLDDFRSVMESEGGHEVASEEYEVDALPARKLTYTYEDELGSVFAIYVVTQTDPGTVHEFILWGEAHEQESTLALFEDFLSTFEPSG